MKQAIKTNAESVRAHWYVWLFPFFAFIISGFLIYQHYRQKGEMIRIHFDEASVMTPEKTRLRFRGVTVGIVKQITIADDNKGVFAHVLLEEGMEQFAVEGSKFWLVSPKIGIEGFSGLETILGGPYIAVLPGKPDAPGQIEFSAKLGTEASDPLENTTAYYLESPTGESIAVGAAVSFRGIPVGTVSKMTLSKNSQNVVIQINIQNKYDRLIRVNTTFWRKVGIQADLGLFGSSVKVNSLDSIMHGGIEFATPDPAGPQSKALANFALVGVAPKDYGKWNPRIEN